MCVCVISVISVISVIRVIGPLQILDLGDLLGGGLGDLGLGTMERSYHIGLVRPSSIQQGSGVRLASSERVSKQHEESAVSATFNL